VKKLLATTVAGIVAVTLSLGCTGTPTTPPKSSDTGSTTTTKPADTTKPAPTKAAEPTKPAATRAEPPKDGTIGLTIEDVEVEKGGSKEATVTIVRGGGFDGDVTLTFEVVDAESGLTVPKEMKVEKGKDKATVKIEAKEGAKGGKVKVTAKGEKAKTDTKEITVKTKDK
jgi:hypothetical protein